MSLNIVDSFLDKFSFSSKEINIPFGKKFTGSQNLLGTNQCLSQSIPTEFLTPFMDNEYFSVDHTKMNRSNSLDSKMNGILHYFEPTNHKLVGRVSKLLSPMLNSHDPFRIVPDCLEILRDPEFMKQGFKILCEEVEQHFDKMNKQQLDSKSKSGSSTNNSTLPPTTESDSKPKNCNKSDKASNQMNSFVENMANKEINVQVKSNRDANLQPGLSVSIEITSSPNKVLNPDKNSCHRTNFSDKSPNKAKMPQNMTVSHVPDSKKPLANNNQTMNEELTNRKNKELQKRSKKRRRRQKKNNQTKDTKDETTPNTANANPSNSKSTPKSPNTANASPSNSPTTAKSSDIFCDIVRNGVQILLPNSSSFVISIESAEDDSDWDSTDCSEWLNDCSEFELSGIFISNLSTPLSCFSQLSVASSPSAEEAEMRRLGKVLRQINENWVKDMKGLDTKPRVATKVSFAPDDKLVDIVEVDVFDRKGEWETFATERMRFKRRIEELEKIISPCLSLKHREKILSRFQISDL